MFKLFSLTILALSLVLSAKSFAGFSLNGTILNSAVEYNVTTTAVKVLSSNINRSYMSVNNRGGSAIVVKLGSAPVNDMDGIAVAAGSSYAPDRVPTASVYVRGFSGTQAIFVIEANQL